MHDRALSFGEILEPVGCAMAVEAVFGKGYAPERRKMPSRSVGTSSSKLTKLLMKELPVTCSKEILWPLRGFGGLSRDWSSFADTKVMSEPESSITVVSTPDSPPTLAEN